MMPENHPLARLRRVPLRALVSQPNVLAFWNVVRQVAARQKKKHRVHKRKTAV
jgi:hypothetical protein